MFCFFQVLRVPSFAHVVLLLVSCDVVLGFFHIFFEGSVLVVCLLHAAEHHLETAVQRVPFLLQFIFSAVSWRCARRTPWWL